MYNTLVCAIKQLTTLMITAIVWVKHLVVDSKRRDLHCHWNDVDCSVDQWWLKLSFKVHKFFPAISINTLIHQWISQPLQISQTKIHLHRKLTEALHSAKEFYMPASFEQSDSTSNNHRHQLAIEVVVTNPPVNAHMGGRQMLKDMRNSNKLWVVNLRSACHFSSSSSSSSSACPELERSGFHEALPVFSILGASPSRVEAMIMRLEICSQGM